MFKKWGSNVNYYICGTNKKNHVNYKTKCILKKFHFILQSALSSHMFGSLLPSQKHLNKEGSSPIEFLPGSSSYAFPNLFMLGWAFEALSCSFKFFKKWRGETKRLERPTSEIESIFSMNAVQWHGIVCLFCVFWCCWPLLTERWMLSVL